MKRKNFLSAVGATFLTPILTTSRNFTIQERCTIYSILKDAFGPEDRKLFKRVCAVLPEDLKNLEIKPSIHEDIGIDDRAHSLYLACKVISFSDINKYFLSHAIYDYVMDKRDELLGIHRLDDLSLQELNKCIDELSVHTNE